VIIENMILEWKLAERAKQLREAESESVEAIAKAS
jgi:hypothetical protein